MHAILNDFAFDHGKLAHQASVPTEVTNGRSHVSFWVTHFTFRHQFIALIPSI